MFLDILNIIDDLLDGSLLPKVWYKHFLVKNMPKSDAEEIWILYYILKMIDECEQGRNIDDLLEGPVCHHGFERLNWSDHNLKREWYWYHNVWELPSNLSLELKLLWSLARTDILTFAISLPLRQRVCFGLRNQCLRTRRHNCLCVGVTNFKKEWSESFCLNKKTSGHYKNKDADAAEHGYVDELDNIKTALLYKHEIVAKYPKPSETKHPTKLQKKCWAVIFSWECEFRKLVSFPRPHM